MGSTIKLRTVSSVADKRIVLSNSHFCYPVPLGLWTKARIGIRVNMTDTGANFGAAVFAAGLCSGSANIYGDVSTTHFVGCVSADTQWDRLAFISGIYTTHLGPVVSFATKKVGTTETRTSNGGGSGPGPFVSCYSAAADPQKRKLYFVDITKGSPNYTIFCLRSDLTADPDPSKADFLAQMIAATPSYSGHSYCDTARTIAVDEATDGTLDHVNFSWNVTDPKIEICDWAVASII
jgi:hypothetical protein